MTMQIFANNMQMTSRRTVIYPELCYQIYGLCYDIHNIMGSIYAEKQYQDAFEAKLISTKLLYEREKDLLFDFSDTKIKGNKVDFVVENKIVVDLKTKKYITREDFRQMLRYLKSGKYKLGLIINFGRTKVDIKRIVNSDIRI